MKCKWCGVILKNPKARECLYCNGVDFSKLVKTLCVICEMPMKPTLKRYKLQGNFCKDCNMKANSNTETANLREVLANMGIDIYRDLDKI